jgi:hypothetical protein
MVLIMFKYRLTYSDGEIVESDGVFDSAEEAEEYALEAISEYHLGAEILVMHNPGDYPLDDDDDVDFDVFEV